MVLMAKAKVADLLIKLVWGKYGYGPPLVTIAQVSPVHSGRRAAALPPTTATALFHFLLHSTA